MNDRSSKALRTMAQRYAELGLSMIPVRAGRKEPDLSKWEQYQKRRPEDKEFNDWFSQPRNIGIVCGAVSGGLEVLDFDDPRAFRYTFHDLKESVSQTLVAETGRGVHVYLRLKGGGKPKTTSYRRREKKLAWLPLDIRGEGSYVVAPPSVHPSGKPYRFLGEASDILEIEESTLRQRLDQRAEEWPFVEAVLGVWKEGNRHNLALGLAKVLRFQRHFDGDRVEDVIRRLCAAAEDPEVGDRVRAVRDTLTKEADLTAAKSWLGEGLYSTLLELIPKRPHRRGGRRAVAEEEGVLLETFLELPDGRIAEEIVVPDGERFIVYDSKSDSWNIVQEIELIGGVKVKPRPVSKEIGGALTLADGVEEYGSTGTLLKEMEELGLAVFDPMKETVIFRMWIRVALASWIVDCVFAIYVERFASILHTMGPSESGKGRLLTVCRFLFYRSLFFLKTIRVPSLFRAIDPWHGTLVLDEADLAHSSESAEFIEFLNARATGSTIPRYDAESGEMRFFSSFGHTVVATRKPYTDDGANSRSVFLSAEATTRNDIDLVPPREWLEKAKTLQRKLLLWRLRHLAQIQRGDIVLPTRLDLSDVQSFRVKEAFLVLKALEREEPELVKDMAEIAKEIDRRLVVERAASPEGLVLGVVYTCLLDEAFSVEQDGTAFRLLHKHEINEGGKPIVERQPLTLRTVAESLGKTFSSSEIARYWRGLGQGTKARDRVDGRRFSGIMLIMDPSRLDREFKKFVVDAEGVVDHFPKPPDPTSKPDVPLEKLESDIRMHAAGTTRTSGTKTSSETQFVPPVPLVPPKTRTPVCSSDAISDVPSEERKGEKQLGEADKDRVEKTIRQLAVLAHWYYPEDTEDEAVRRVIDDLQSHGLVADSDHVKAVVKDVIEQAAKDRLGGGGSPP